METFGERLKRFRRERGLTQMQIADALNIHEQTVSRWERDKSSPDMSMFATLSKTLGVSLEELWGLPEGSIDQKKGKGEFTVIGLGKRISAERKRTNESQTTLATALNVSSDTVSKWERGVICPDLTTFFILADHFGISPAKLYYAAEAEGTTNEQGEGSGSEGLGIAVTGGTASQNADATANKKRKFIILLSAVALVVLMIGGVLLGSYLLNQGSKPAACGHNYESTIVAATCTAQGYATYTCTLCGDSYKSELPITSHTESDWIVDNTSTCTIEGSKHKECTVCGKILERLKVEKAEHNYESENIVATCTTQGYTTYTCLECGDSYQTDYLPILSHTESDWIVDKTSTCAIEGSKHKECLTCKKVLESQKIDKTEHAYESVSTAATCTAQGYTTYTCTACGDKYTANYLPAIAHTGTDWIIDRLPTCAIEGIKHKECKDCKQILERQSIEKTSHDYKHTNTLPTCTTQGYTTYTCTACGDNYKTNYFPTTAHTSSDWIIDKTETCIAEGSKHKECTACGKILETQTLEKSTHSYESQKVPATCAEQGYTTYTCTLCGDSYKSDFLPTLSHTGSDWIVDKAATCKVEGSRHKECTACKKVLETQSIAKSAHAYESVNKPATCTAQGYTTYTCTVCEYSYQSDFIPVLAHTVGDWIIEKAATCTLEGGQHKECTACGTVIESQKIEKSAHSYKSTNTLATCTTQGYTTHTCTVCKYSYQSDFIPMLSHTGSDWIVDKAATCTLDGSQHKECTACKKVLESQSIAKTEHSYGKTVVPATCIAQGYTTYRCTVCSESYEKDYTPMTTHTQSDWIVDTPATCTADGSRHKECTYCHASMETQTINMTGHSYNEQLVPPLNGARGYTLHVCSNCGDSYKDTYIIGGSQGLSYEFDNMSKTFTVVGIGICTDTEISIPKSVNGYPLIAIADYAFSKSTATAFWIPSSVQTIGAYAFSDCDNLLSITIPMSVTMIGSSIFEDCNNLAEVIYNCDFGPFSEVSFLKLPSLKKVIFGGNMVPDFICNGAANIEEVVIPYGINYIGEKAFMDCINLKVIDLPDSVSSIGADAFNGCGVTELVLPLSMTSANTNMCYGARNLKKVTLPKTMESLAYGAFRNCESLVSINLENVKIIDQEVFDGCKSLTEVTLPDGIMRINAGTFAWCARLRKINIPSSVTVIDDWAFYNCVSLKNIILPNNLTTIGGNSFTSCRSLTEIVIPASVNSIANDSFLCDDNLTKVVFECPDGWSAGNQKLDSLKLKDPATAATYLKETYSGVSWKRS